MKKEISKKRRSFSTAAKFRIVLEAIKGQRQIPQSYLEIASHPFLLLHDPMTNMILTHFRAVTNLDLSVDLS